MPKAMKRVSLFRRLSLIFFVLGGVFPMAAFEPTPGDHALTFTAGYDGSLEPYRLFIPEQARDKIPLPLLVVLHGKGADQNTWFDYTPVRKFAAEKGYVVAAPQARGDYFYRGAAEQDVLDMIRIVQDMLPIDPDRIYLMGHSMGGWGCFWIGLRNPDVFAALCPMSGFAPSELLSNARHLSLFMIHDSDDPVVPVQNFRDAAVKLASLGISFRYKEEQGYGHDSKMIGNNFPELFDWMEAKRRISNPRRITITTRTPYKGKARWISILETLHYPKLAYMDAEFQSPDHLKISTNNIRRLGINLTDLPFDLSGDLKIAINQMDFMISSPKGWILFDLDPVRNEWQFTLSDSWPQLRLRNQSLAHISADDPMVTSPTLMTSAAAFLLCEETGGDLCLFLPDAFRFPGGDVTEDRVLDLYVYPEERLARFTYQGEPLPMIISMQPQFFPTGKYDPKSRKAYQVIAPLNIAEKFDLPLEIMPDVTGEYLLRALSRKKSFP